MKQVNFYDYNLFQEIRFLVVVTGMTFLTWTAIKINRKLLLLLEFSCLNDWIIVFILFRVEIKKNRNKLCYFLTIFSPRIP